MRFRFIAEYSGDLPINRLCETMGVSPRGYRAFRSRPLSNSQCKDSIVLAHIHEQFALSLGSYGRTRMTEELNHHQLKLVGSTGTVETVLFKEVGHRRIDRLMRDDGIRIERSKNTSFSRM